MTNEELIEILKAQIDTSSPAGLSSAQDAEEFIDLSIDQTAVLRKIRTVTQIKRTFNLDSLALGEPVIVAATEGQAPAEADVRAVVRTRKALTPKSILAAFDVPFDFLKKNIEGRDVNATLNDIFAKRFGKDIVLVAFGGDTALDTSTATNKALRIFDGIVKQALADAGVNDYTVPASPSYSTQVFPGMLNLLPKDYADQVEELAYFVSGGVYRAYLQELGGRPSALGDNILTGQWGERVNYLGVELIPVYGLADANPILTLRQNIAVGFGDELEIGQDISNRERLLKVTMTADVDATYIEGGAMVLGSA